MVKMEYVSESAIVGLRMMVKNLFWNSSMQKIIFSCLIKEIFAQKKYSVTKMTFLLYGWISK